MATVPSAPSAFIITSYADTWFEGGAHANSNGGAPILEWQLAWGKSPNSAEFTGNVNLENGEAFVVGLDVGDVYYVWNRQRNAVGWSPMSARTSVKLLGPPDPPKPPAFAFKEQTAIQVMTGPNGNGGYPITKYKLGYATNDSITPPLPTDTITQTSPLFRLTGLNAGKRYFFWAKAINSRGESDWSPRTSITLVAGAMVKVGPVWKRAIPYVKVAGVWRMTRPWSRSSGVWKESAD